MNELSFSNGRILYHFNFEDLYNHFRASKNNSFRQVIAQKFGIFNLGFQIKYFLEILLSDHQ